MEKLVPVLLLLPVFVCAGSFSDGGATGLGGAAGSADKSSSALERATTEFKTRTRELGLRPDSPPGTRVPTGPKMLWHGSIYENFRNDVLDAIPREIRQVGGDKGLLRRNQFGFNVGGPLIVPHLLRSHNSTFFSVSYEGVRERIARTFLRTIPTEAERGGDFSHTVDLSGNLLPIYDPATTAPNPNYDAAQPVSADNPQYLREQFRVT